MNNIILVFFVTLFTFLIAFLSRNKFHNVPKFEKYYTHHSLVGVLIMIASFFTPYFFLFFSIGVGIFLAHGIEEIYFSHSSFVKAFFVFITKSKSQNFSPEYTFRQKVLAIIGLIVCISIFVILYLFMGKTADTNSVRYAVIGDSYSNGEGATPEQSWPSLLTQHLKKQGIALELVSNPSITGWTTQQAIENELPEFMSVRPTFATILIGVNDYVQGVPPHQFEKNIIVLLDSMQRVLPDPHALVIITIPDYSITPTGKLFQVGGNASSGIEGYNAILASQAKKRNLTIVDIFTLSQHMQDSPGLIATDGLHPSAKEYALWEHLIYPAVLQTVQQLHK